MLSNEQLALLNSVGTLFTKILKHLPEPLRAEAETVALAAQAAVQAGLASRATLTGRPRSPTNGRPPSTVFVVDFTDYEPRYAVGAQRAVEMVNADLTEAGVKKRLTVNNLTTTISTKGEWSTKLATGNGEMVLAVRRASAAQTTKVLAEYAEFMAKKSAQ